jgi:hypothetical protein
MENHDQVQARGLVIVPRRARPSSGGRLSPVASTVQAGSDFWGGLDGSVNTGSAAGRCVAAVTAVLFGWESGGERLVEPGRSDCQAGSRLRTVPTRATARRPGQEARNRS